MGPPLPPFPPCGSLMPTMNRALLARGLGGTALLGCSLWAFRQWLLQRARATHGMHTEAVKGFLGPFNFVFDVVRGLTGLALVRIKRDQFLAEAQEIARMTDPQIFGPQEDFVEAVGRFVNAPDQSRMSGSGIILLNYFISRCLSVRRETIEYIQRHPDTIIAGRLDKPIIISGLPRTGSTMLYNLLACDPACRAPRFFEISHMASPVPPATSPQTREEDPRIQKVEQHFDKTERLYPRMWTEAGKSHRSHPNEIEEDLLVMFHSFVMQLHVSLGAHSPYRSWYDQEDKEYAYIYHRLYFQMLQSAWTPALSHWVLKAPVHSTYLDDLMKQYPDARVILTHRDPHAVVPSWARLLESYVNWYYMPQACDRHEYGRYIFESLVLCAQRVMEWRERTDPQVYFDVVYRDMVKDPIAMVECIYAHFDLPMSEAFRDNMRAWIRDNRQGKWGRREYALEDYGLKPEEVDRSFADYVRTFLPSTSSSSSSA